MVDEHAPGPFDGTMAELAHLADEATQTADRLNAAAAGPMLADDATRPVGEWLAALALEISTKAAEAHSVLYDWTEGARNGSDYAYPEPPGALLQEVERLRATYTDDEVAAAIMKIVFPHLGASA